MKVVVFFRGDEHKEDKGLEGELVEVFHGTMRVRVHDRVMCIPLTSIEYYYEVFE